MGFRTVGLPWDWRVVRCTWVVCVCVCVCVWSSVAAVAREPRNLEHTFIIISNNITARLSWHEPDSLDVMLSGYRVVWGQLVQSDPIQMDSAALTKVLPKVRIRSQLLDHRDKDRPSYIYSCAQTNQPRINSL